MSELEKLAKQYVRDCLAIMDGTTKKGIVRLGAERFRRTVREVLRTFSKLQYFGGAR